MFSGWLSENWDSHCSLYRMDDALHFFPLKIMEYDIEYDDQDMAPINVYYTEKMTKLFLYHGCHICSKDKIKVKPGIPPMQRPSIQKTHYKDMHSMIVDEYKQQRRRDSYGLLCLSFLLR